MPKVKYWDGTQWVEIGQDHGALAGLSGDDHTQYALADGTRGNFEAAGAVTGHEGAADPHSAYALAAGDTFTGDVTIQGTLTADTLKYSGPAGYVWVPGNPKYGTMPGFWVMQYEAKNDGSGNPISQADTTPWVSIDWYTARQKAASLGSGYHLITENEWLTIAANVAAQPQNWANGVIGSTVASGGGLFRGNVGILDSASYNGADPEFGTGRDTKARLQLSTGDYIWDFSGNTWSWVDAYIYSDGTGDEMPAPNTGWVEYTAVTDYKSLGQARPPDPRWNATHGIGRIYSDPDAASPSGNYHAFLRGGYWDDGENAGVWSLPLNYAPESTNAGVGFRVARSP